MNEELDRFLNRIWFCMEYSGRSGDETKPQWWISHETLFRWYRCMRKVVTKPFKRFEIMTFAGDYTKELLVRNFANWHISLRRKVKGSRLWLLDFASTAEAGIGESYVRIRFVHPYKSGYICLDNISSPYRLVTLPRVALEYPPVRCEWPGTQREVYVPTHKSHLIKPWYGKRFFEDDVSPKIDRDKLSFKTADRLKQFEKPHNRKHPHSEG